MVSRTFFYIHHEIQMGFQHTISGSTESYPQSFPLGQRPCHPQQSFCFVSPRRPQLPGDCARSSHEVPSRELPQPRSISESQVPLFPIGMQLHNRRDGNTVEHQPPSAQWKTFGTSTDGLFGTRADHSRSGGVNQGNINSLAAVLGTDDLRQSLWSWLTQQLSWKSVRVRRTSFKAL